ncbi:hypothetical protein AMC87_CH02909 [Rhizobium phaseoli]|uniref:hypothetical protein n=1 Tax=Rhizobium phaseoli TaxID=396 RepID=UPI0007EAE92D|nr:hypothetical protein [Rhizobium phaseoli]ANL47574.1 hypothetical protein AMC87_CH02909 [Rhizobium phaseoli]
MQSDAVPIPEALSNLGMHFANVLAKSITNQSEQWYFVTHMYDQLLTEISEGWLQLFPFRLFEIEYRWGKIEPFVFEVRGNPGLDYINKQVLPSLLEKLDADLVNLTIAHAYWQYCIHYLPYIHDARRVFAEHFRENFRRDGHNDIADRWDEVLRSLRS